MFCPKRSALRANKFFLSKRQLEHSISIAALSLLSLPLSTLIFARPHGISEDLLLQIAERWQANNGRKPKFAMTQLFALSSWLSVKYRLPSIKRRSSLRANLSVDLHHLLSFSFKRDRTSQLISHATQCTLDIDYVDIIVCTASACMMYSVHLHILRKPK